MDDETEEITESQYKTLDRRIKLLGLSIMFAIIAGMIVAERVTKLENRPIAYSKSFKYKPKPIKVIIVKEKDND